MWSRRSDNMPGDVLRGSNPTSSIFFAKIPIFHFHGPCRHGGTGRGNEIRNAVFWDIHAHKPNLSGMQTCHGCCLAHSKRKQYQNPTRGFKISPRACFRVPHGTPRRRASTAMRIPVDSSHWIFEIKHITKCVLEVNPTQRFHFCYLESPIFAPLCSKLIFSCFCSPMPAPSKALIFLENVMACAFSST